MHVQNVEFKARVDDLTWYEQKLLTLQPRFHGLDHQIDTYFNTTHGRLKLREGNIEHALIHYDREDLAGSKSSQVILYTHQPDPALKAILTKHLGIKTIVDKQRKIYFIDHVKFHFDTVDRLGTFIEVEVIDNTGAQPLKVLQSLCDDYFQFFELTSTQMVAQSYSDLLLGQA